ncbi:hypothetical protein Vadar_011445 [Vaccinium darrowii]|uniref:Uncharacterized protein n=1 Tax=Vaccinium darrowii TaxID=229202 RepID=A0ACB7YE30_9ERIC|nr:hypothetical protein Vadar_011445 [Vaccinium darrowii]
MPKPVQWGYDWAAGVPTEKEEGRRKKKSKGIYKFLDCFCFRIRGSEKNSTPKNPDRNSALLAWEMWIVIDRNSRHSVIIEHCYAVSPGRVIKRFPAVKSLTTKGMPRVGDASWVPRYWGGSVHNWVVGLANQCKDLEELRLKRMVVSDETLVLISTALPNFKSVVLISCVGFSGKGLDAIASNCRFTLATNEDISDPKEKRNVLDQWQIMFSGFQV